MKKIPPGSEASNVLVGEVDFLSHSIIAFVRLSEGRILGDLTEVPIPTRFLFILLGPTGNQERYHEIGRSIATLMSDEVHVRTTCTCTCSLDSRPLSIEKDGLVYTVCACVICPKNLGDRDILVN